MKDRGQHAIKLVSLADTWNVCAPEYFAKALLGSPERLESAVSSAVEPLVEKCVE
ncbi:hypothetical protein GPECTOR_30g229 [Gonium pectorale]|uniref:Uncharacterized protein n=1 Tax=Gonium pectorale TaxID=33097 RepID=A0A150GEC8_GONPE|nr:hypothetical protein GPECTOR_30g229 [Gonium pectorale]|eukprot:KXZ48133.1 hypothetical protein GPECTOR_30g229 [Gonium pectorale]